MPVELKEINKNTESPEILVVDDSATMRNFLTRVLCDEYQVHTAKDGIECIANYLKYSPKVILLDLLMPNMNGFDVINKIRRQINDNDVFIIVLTGQDEQDIKARALNEGANDYLTKPFHVIELKARVGVAIRQFMLNKELLQANNDLRMAYEIIDDEVKLVAMLQNKLLPREQPSIAGLKLTSLYRPSGRASGDYYDAYIIGENALRVIVADVSGHGPQSAFIMAIVRTLFRADGGAHRGLGVSIEHINKHLLDLIGDDSYFVTLFAADLDFEAGELRYISAGHCPALFMVDGKMLEPIKAQIPPLGFFDIKCQPDVLKFESALDLFIFTDGCYEWRMGDEYFNLDAFLDIAQDLMKKGELEINHLEDVFERDTGHRPVFDDDVTAITLEWRKS